MTIEDGHFSFVRKEAGIRREAGLDGIYVIRTSEPAERLSAPEAVRNCKNLTLVESAFRCLKGVDLRIRPINHYREPRVRAHIFLCMLAYYVEWHMRKVLALLLFQDEELGDLRKTRDQVARAAASQTAKPKKKPESSQTSDSSPIHSFSCLMADLGTLCLNQCRLWGRPRCTGNRPPYYRHATPTQSNATIGTQLFPVSNHPKTAYLSTNQWLMPGTSGQASRDSPDAVYLRTWALFRTSGQAALDACRCPMKYPEGEVGHVAGVLPALFQQLFHRRSQRLYGERLPQGSVRPMHARIRERVHVRRDGDDLGVRKLLP